MATLSSGSPEHPTEPLARRCPSCAESITFVEHVTACPKCSAPFVVETEPSKPSKRRSRRRRRRSQRKIQFKVSSDIRKYLIYTIYLIVGSLFLYWMIGFVNRE